MLRASRAVLKINQGHGVLPKNLAWESQSSIVESRLRFESRSAASQAAESSSESPKPPPRNGGGWFWKLLGLTLVGSGGVVGYAWYDPDFRKTLIDYAPYMKEPLDLILQSLPPSPSQETPTSIKKDETIASSSLPKPKTTSVQPVIQSPAPVQLALPAPSTKEDQKSRAEILKQEAAEKKRLEKEKAEKAVKDQEHKEVVENKELEFLLERTVEEACRAVTQAVNAVSKATEAMNTHSARVKQAMQTTGSDAEWLGVGDAHTARTEALRECETAQQKAKASLDKLKSVVVDGKSNKTTKKNKLISSSEAEYNKLNNSLTTAITQLQKAEADTKAMSGYKDLAKKGKEQFQTEIEFLAPDVKSEKKSKLSTDELNKLIAHAHSKIEQIQLELAKHQALEPQRIEKALDRQKLEDEKHATELVQLERERMKTELLTLLQTWEAEYRVDTEREMRAQLTRQAAAHSDHIIEVLRVQQKELEGKYRDHLEERLKEEREKFESEVSDSVGRLKGIEGAVEARAELEKRAQKAHSLWLACQSLTASLSRSSSDLTNFDGPNPLTSELQAVREAGCGNPFVTTILGSIPEAAVKQGVWTEIGLAERFQKVSRLGRRVALIDERGGTLFRYFLSYLQSVLVIRSSRSISRDTLVTPGDLGTFEILDNATSCMERGDLEQAVKFVNQLRGESRKVASDWLKEARLLLETRQAAEALLSYATATGISSLF